MFAPDDTIVALATPQGRGGVGVVRIAGPRAVDIAGGLIDRAATLEPRHATFARVIDRSAQDGTRQSASDGTRLHMGAVVDHVVVTWFAAPQSYTGDDVVEISGHGSPVLLQRVITLAMESGARLAEPGEFTFRAYLNGRIDLVQAEAVADLADAVTPRQARAAMDQLEGTLTSAIAAIDAKLFDLAARLEASLDFPDEGFHFVTPAATREELTTIGGDLAALQRDGRRGRVLREGRNVVIAGPPNAGKSSVFNALAGAARAIVTDIPGTTRDVLTEKIDLDGVPITLMDTAGLRDSDDRVEIEGVARARQARDVAALTVVVFDHSRAWTTDDDAVLEEIAAPRVVAINKCDLAPAWHRADGIEISAATGAGLDALRQAILRALLADEDLRDTPAISNARHLELVTRAAESVAAAIGAIDRGETEEVILVELGAARGALEAITGRRDSEDLLRYIFSRFCIGK